MNATTSQTVESRESRAEGQPPRTDPRNSNIVPFTPPSLLDAMQAEHERIANLICRANDAVNLEPPQPSPADVEEYLARQK